MKDEKIGTKNFIIIMTCFFLCGFGSVYAYQYYTFEQGVVTIYNYGADTIIEKGKENIGSGTKQDTKPNKQTKQSNGSVKAKDKRPVQSLQGQQNNKSDNAGTGKSLGIVKISYTEMRNKIMSLGIDYEIAEHIVFMCTTQARDRDVCIKNIIGVSNAESSMFKRCYKNNCFGILNKGVPIAFESIKHGIDDWIIRHEKYWYKLEGQEFLTRARYCYEGDGGCKNWVSNYWDAVNKLGL